MALNQWQRPDYPGLTSVNQLLLWVKARSNAPIMHAKRADAWQPLTGRQFYDRVRSLAAGLIALQMQPGDRVAILSENRPEWLIADFACMSIGLIDVPVYPTLTAEQVAQILQHSGARGIFVSNIGQFAKIQQQWANLSDLDWVCCFEVHTNALPGRRLIGWEELIESATAIPEEAFDSALKTTPPDRIATLIYTSGTTGLPKGVMLTHENLVSNLNYAVVGFPRGENECRLSFLPLSHITERHLGYCDFVFEQVTYFAESIEKVPQNLLEVKPTFIVSTPRLYEKMASKIRAQTAAKGATAEKIFAWAQSVGRRMAPYRLAATVDASGQLKNTRRPPLRLRLANALADRLVYKKVRDGIGGRVNKAIAGGAPLGKDLAEFMLSLGFIIDQGYGLTETSPVIAVNKPGARRLGSVGKPLPNVEVRFDSDGELLVRGPSIFSGYFRSPAETQAAFTDGWFRTGDIGHQDADGFLYITDRKKDLIKTSGGKFIAPQPIELRLKDSAWVAEAVVVGDRRNYATALIVPNFAAIEDYARQHNLKWSERQQLCELPQIRALIADHIEFVNSKLARFETLKKFTLLPNDFTIAGGEITPTVKVRRRTIEEKYRHLIDNMYEVNTHA